MQGKGFGAAGVLLAAALGAGLYAPGSYAATYDWDYFGGIDASINTSFSLGAQVRLTKPHKPTRRSPPGAAHQALSCPMARASL